MKLANLANEFRQLLKDEVTTVISELQLLEADMADPNWELGTPDKYTTRQKMVLSPLVDILKEISTKCIEEKKAYDAKKEKANGNEHKHGGDTLH